MMLGAIAAGCVFYAVAAVPVAVACERICRWLQDERGWVGLAPPGDYERGITALVWPVFLIGTILFLATDFFCSPVQNLGELVGRLAQRKARP